MHDKCTTLVGIIGVWLVPHQALAEYMGEDLPKKRHQNVDNVTHLLGKLPNVRMPNKTQGEHASRAYLSSGRSSLSDTT